jgi:type IV pilus assembly protein PilQ
MVITAGCVVAIAESNDSNTGNKEVLSTLGQRMQKRVSVDFRDTPIEDVIRIMAEQSGVDIVKSPKVTGSVTATLTNVPLEEALNNILISQGYGYVASNNMIRIAPLEEMSEASERLVSRIYRITYANVAEVETALKKFVSPRGSVSSNPGTSNIIVTDSESKIKAIDTFIEEIDRITPQIEVEARIYDITSQDKLDLGVEWNAGSDTTYYTGTTAVVPPGTLGNNPTGIIEPFTTGVFLGATGKTSSTTGVFRFGWLKDNMDIDVMLRAQQNLINAKLLANPRILVLDNETAEIEITSEIPYQELTETSGGGSIGSTSFKNVGVILNVKPHLTRDGKIRLLVAPEFSVQTGSVTFTTTGLTYPQPIIAKRKAQTTLLVDNGRTVVLGGLRKKEATKQVNKIPLLGDLPLIGLAFRFEGEDTTTSELVVFITPRIIDKPVLTGIERQQLEVTDFNGPLPVSTRAEESIAKAKTKAKK